MRGMLFLMAGVLLGFAVLGVILNLDRTAVIVAASMTSVALLPILLTEGKRGKACPKSPQ